MAPYYLQNDITMEIEVKNRETCSAHSMNVYVPYIDQESSKMKFTYTGAKIWNA